MKMSEMIVAILAAKQKRSANAIIAKYGPALEAADEAGIKMVADISSACHASFEERLKVEIPLKDFGGVRAEMSKEMPEWAKPSSSFSQPTKFATESERTGFISGLQCDLESSRNRMAQLWKERDEANNSFQERITAESEQIDLLEARIHLTGRTPAVGSIPGLMACGNSLVPKGGF